MAKVSLHLEIIVINMGCKFIAALLGLLLLACSSIHAAYTNIEEGTIHAENTLPLEYPAASSVDELIRQSSGEHNEMVSRKFLRSAVRRGLTESKKAEEFEAKRIKSDDSLHVLLDRDLASKGRAGIANDHHELLLSGASLNHISTQNERKIMTANEPNKLVAASMQVTPRQIYEKPSFHVDYSGPKTHNPKHH